MRPQGRGQPSTPLLPLQTNPGWKGACPAVQPPWLTLGPTPRWQCGAEHSDGPPEILVCRLLPRASHLAQPRPSSFVPMISLFTSFPPECQLPSRTNMQVRHQHLASTLLRLLAQPVGHACRPCRQPWQERPAASSPGRWRKEMTEIGKGFPSAAHRASCMLFSLVLRRQS